MQTGCMRQSNGKFWQKRKNSAFQVGRVISAHPAEGEHYFLHVLLTNVAGATSYKHLRTVDGVLLPSFCEVAEMSVRDPRDTPQGREKI